MKVPLNPCFSMKTLKQSFKDAIFKFSKFENAKSSRATRVIAYVSSIIKLLHESNYSVCWFKYNRRRKANALPTNLIVIDVDSIQSEYSSVQSFSSSIINYNHIVTTTKSHRADKNGVVCDRYRVILFLTEPISDPLQYKINIECICRHLRLDYDKRCVDMGRLFYPSIEVVSANFHGESIVPISAPTKVDTSNKKDFKYIEAEIAIPTNIANWINIKNLGQTVINKRLKFTKILIAQKYLLDKNPLPQSYIANYLCIRRNTLRSWINDFIKNGWLKVFTDYYGKGWTAKTYRAIGDLETVIMQYFNYNNRYDCYAEFSLPTNINDGEWHRTLYLATFKFKNNIDDSKYIAWVKSLDGWEKGTRLKQAKDAFKSMKRWISEQDEKKNEGND